MQIAPIAKYPLAMLIIKPATQAITAKGNEITAKDAHVAVTPCPPQKPFQKGKPCPNTAPKPAYAAQIALSEKAIRAMAQAINVFAKSPIKTAAARSVPNCAPTLAIPGLPVPMLNALFPIDIFAIISAVSMQPKA